MIEIPIPTKCIKCKKIFWRYKNNYGIGGTFSLDKSITVYYCKNCCNEITVRALKGDKIDKELMLLTGGEGK